MYLLTFLFYNIKIYTVVEKYVSKYLKKNLYYINFLK